MLILSREKGESVLVGRADGFRHRLRVTVLSCAEQNVVLGFEVDKSVPILRSELLRRPRPWHRPGPHKGKKISKGQDGNRRARH
jgi:sRNA-binding carbon storage regulator CsrA